MSARVLAVCTGGGVGDLMAALPAIRALRRFFGAPVDVLASPYAAPVLQDNPAIGSVIEDDPAASSRDLGRRLARLGHSHAVVFWSTARIADAVRRSGIPVRVGQSRRLYSWKFTVRVPVRSESGDRLAHWTDVQMDYARALGVEALASDYGIEVRLRDEDRSQADALIDELGVREGFIVFHCARGIALDRVEWPVGRFGQIADALSAAAEVPVLLTGSRADASTIARIAEVLRVRGASVAGRTTLMGLAALLARARAVVALDSGPMHIAAALGAPTVGIFALRTDLPDRWRPLGPNVAIVRPAYPCPPWHRKETCRSFACYAALSPETVVAAMRSALGRAGAIAGAAPARPSA